jgi:protein-L-isoaspartate(D-aspartate) O-methyltransferase
VPEALRDQLSIGGRIIMPVGREQRSQRLVQVVRESEQDFEEKKLSYVRFVPLIGKQGWKKEKRRWTDFF